MASSSSSTSNAAYDEAVADFFKLESMPGPPQYGYASKLRRHGATLAQHATLSMTDFAKTLVDCKGDLKIEEVPEEYIEEKYQIPEIRCSRCNKELSNGTELVEHILDDHTRNKADKVIYEMTGTIKPAANAIVKESLGNQTRMTHIVMKFANSDHILKVNVSSPLVPFLAQNGLKVYLNEPPVNRASWRHKFVTVELEGKKKEASQKIIFAFTWIERQKAKMRTARKAKMEEKTDKEMTLKCAHVNISSDDLFFKQRTPEEDRYLAQAFGLPADFTQEQLQRVVADNTVIRPVKIEQSTSYSDTQAPDGHVMTTEERRLISTLSGDFIHVGGRKRTCAVAKRFSSGNY